MMLSNETRIEAAKHAVDEYQDFKPGGYDHLENMAGDLITDLLHLIDSIGADPAKKLAAAFMNFEAEKDGNNG